MITGGCQCGAVRYRATKMLDNAHLCHCRMCQKAVGGLFAVLVAAPDEDLAFTRGTPATFRSSDHVDRGFCAACGTPLFYRHIKSGRTNLTMGSLDQPAAFPPKVQMGVESRVPWWRALDDLAPDEAAADGSVVDEEVALAQRSNRQHPDHDT